MSSATNRIGLRTIQRPDGGASIGRNIAVQSNYYPINIDFSKTFFQYSVEVECQFSKNNGGFGKFSVSKDYREFYLRKVLDGKIDPNTYVFNGDSILYSTQEIKETQFSKSLPGESREKTEDTYLITMSFSRSLNFRNLETYLKNPRTEFPQPEVALIDLVYRQNRLKSHIYMSRCLFNLKSKNDTIDLSKTGLFICTGHYQSLRPTQNGWKFNVDLKSCIFHYETSLGHFLVDYFGLNPDKQMTNEQVRKISQDIKGLFITVPHLKTNRKFRILGLGKSADDEIFIQHDGTSEKRTLSVAQYFKEAHFELMYPHLPCVITSKTPRMIMYPIEACDIPTGQRFMKPLPARLQSIMVKDTAYKPNEHKNRIDYMATEQHTDTRLLLNFGIQEVDSKQMMTIPAHILDPINILYNSNQTIRTRDGQWRMQNRMTFLEPGSLSSWLIIWTCKDDRRDDKYNDMIRMKLRQGLLATVKRSGIKVLKDPIMQNLSRFSIEEIFKLIKEKVREKPQLIVFIINDLNDCYNKIKSMAELECGYVTQCMKFDKLVSQMDFKVDPDQVQNDRRLSSYLENVCQKINSKIGGINITTEMKSFSLQSIDAEPVMFFGADVATVESLGKSYAAVVGSYDLNFSKYSVRVSEQINARENKSSQEIILNMEEMAFLLLRKFEQKNGRFPTRIIFYRDGIDSGQLQDVLDQEMCALKRACARMNKSPKITMIVVIKRHHTKFYPTKQEDTINSGNLVPGTVIDKQVTSPGNFDFYMISHHAALGTAKPTYYWVIFDENNFSSNEIQKLTFTLCHLYASCTKSVSLPAPVYYAHLAAYRGIAYSDYMSLDNGLNELSMQELQVTKTRLIEVSPDLEEKMFFI